MLFCLVISIEWTSESIPIKRWNYLCALFIQQIQKATNTENFLTLTLSAWPSLIWTIHSGQGEFMLRMIRFALYPQLIGSSNTCTLFP